MNKKTTRETKKQATSKKKISSRPDIIAILKTEQIKEPYITYFTGRAVDMGLLLVFSKRKPLLFHSPLEQLPTSTSYDAQVFDTKQIEKLAAKLQAKTIGYDKRHLSVAGLTFLKKMFGKATYTDVSEDIMSTRSIKSAQEIRLLRKAAKITQTILDDLLKVLPSMTYEQEAISFLKIQALKQNVSLSFEPIVASGKHACSPHYTPTATARLQKGFCIIDFGVAYKGYCADISRTVYLGSPSPKEIKIYNQVKEYLHLLEKELCAGKSTIKTPWEIGHALGHGIGLQVHEHPLVGKDTLAEGNVIAVEPAIYTKQYGIRIEDNYVVGKTKLQRISTGSRELHIISV
jgi:Xaa-Pro aminopeptidase